MVDLWSFPNRSFKIWDYLVSHKQMVIRSLGPHEESPNLDLHFRGVEYVCSATSFDGLSIVAPTQDEIIDAKRLLAPKRCDPSMVWVLEANGKRHMVVATELDVSETNFPMMSTALIHPCT